MKGIFEAKNLLLFTEQFSSKKGFHIELFFRSYESKKTCPEKHFSLTSAEPLKTVQLSLQSVA